MLPLKTASVTDLCDGISGCLEKAQAAGGSMDLTEYTGRALVLALTGCMVQLERIADAQDDQVGRV